MRVTSSMQRTAARGRAAAVVVVALALVAPVAAVAAPPSAASATQQAQQVDSCRVIDAPGEYELAGDVTASAADACIRVAASDVVLDGNGHTIAGQNASGDGVLVFRGEDGSPTAEDALENVTVRNLTAANWSNGVAVGTLGGGGTDVHLSGVTVRENRYAGLRLTDVENVTARNVTATGNDDGVTLWAVQNSTLRDVTASGNSEYGVALLQVARGNTVRNLTATDNGGGPDRGAGVYLSTDTGDNGVVDAAVRDNRGPGVQFSDSFGNTLRDSVVAGNDGAGVFGVPAYEDALRNVTVRANGGPAVGHGSSEPDSEFVADGLHLGDAASLSFPADPVTVQRADATDLPEPPRPLATGDAVALSGVENAVTTTLSVDDPAASSLWRYDGSGWHRVGDRRTDTDAGTVSGTVTGDGTVVALDAPSQREGNGSEEDGDESEEEEENDAEEAVGDGTLVVQATTSGDFGYLFVVDGDAEGVETENVAADSGDQVVDNGDGTVTVVGSTGSNAGDAFEVDGEVVEFYTPAPAADYVLELDGEDVTDEIPEPNEDE
jgi:parallel beta-helix repeat protein